MESVEASTMAAEDFIGGNGIKVEIYSDHRCGPPIARK